MRNRVHPAGAGGSRTPRTTFAPSPRDPEEGSNAFTDVKDAWGAPSELSPEPLARGLGGLVPMLAPIDSMGSDASLNIIPPPRTRETGMIGGEPLGSARSQDSATFLGTPRLSVRKNHADEDVDDEEHRHPTCRVYYAPRNRYATRSFRAPLTRA